MNIKQNQSDRVWSNSGTWGGILFDVFISAAATDTPLTTSDFNFNVIQVNCRLKRGGVVYPIYNDNLLLLGTHYMRRRNYDRFINGQIITPYAVGVKGTYLRTAQLTFPSVITCLPGDELECQVQFNQGGLSANVDADNTFVDFILTPGTGYERGIPMTTCAVVQTNTNQQDFVNADNVRKISFLNLDKTTWASPVINSVTLASDKLNYMSTLYQTIAADNLKWPDNIPYQFGSVQKTPSVVRCLDIAPQMISIYEPMGFQYALNNCRVNLTFNSANVVASQNWVIYDRLIIDRRAAQQTIQRIAKHAKENAARVALGMGS